MDVHDPQRDAGFMARAMELAGRGLGSVSPNPLVGCVIVHEDRIIGEGWHERYGEPHAEVNAIRSVENKDLLPASTLYVTLEPCTHFGKTPPCTDLILDHRIGRVVIANLDSNPNVSGHGVEKLRSVGVTVVTGLLDAECRYVNRRFFTFVEEKRPYIVLKWAETSDRFIAGEHTKWISNEISRQLVHRWRSEEDAVLVGRETAIADNPRLNVRDWTGRDPVRVVLDRYLRLPPTLHLFDKSRKTICYNVLRNEELENITLVKVEEQDFVRAVTRDLYQRNIQSLIVEGGATTLALFIAAGLWDEARVIRSRKLLGKGLAAPSLTANLVAEEPVSGDTLLFFRPVGR